MCLYPHRCYQLYYGDKVVFGEPKYPPDKMLELYPEFRLFSVPCGKCVECMQSRSNEWVHRCLDELKSHSSAVFVTLTYAQTDGNLCYRDFQLFMKSLRKKYSDKTIRYIVCGEYGKKKNRPHFHAILFGIDFNADKRHFFNDKHGCPIYLSETLQSLWKHGFCSLGDVSETTIRYVTKYLTKFDTRPHNVKPFIHMSTRNGIGYNAIKPEMLFTDKIYHNGSYMKIPRYYLKVFEREGIYLDYLKKNRMFKAEIMQRSQETLKKLRQDEQTLKKPFEKVDKEREEVI